MSSLLTGNDESFQRFLEEGGVNEKELKQLSALDFIKMYQSWKEEKDDSNSKSESPKWAQILELDSSIPSIICNQSGEIVQANEAFKQKLGSLIDAGEKPRLEHFFLVCGLSHLRKLMEKPSGKTECILLHHGKDEHAATEYVAIVSPILPEQSSEVFFHIKLADLFESSAPLMTERVVNVYLERLLLLSNGGSWEYHSDGRLFWSDELIGLFKLEDKENYSPSFEDYLSFVHHEDKAFFLASYNRHIQFDENFDITHRIVLKDGTEKWIRSACTSVFSEDRKAYTSWGVTIDVTESVVTQELKQLLVRIGSEFLDKSEENLSNTINEMLASVGNQLKLDRTYIFELDKDTPTLKNTFEWCAEGVRPMIQDLQDISITLIEKLKEEFSIERDFVELHDIDLVKDNLELYPNLVFQDIQSLVLLPLSFQKKEFGYVGFDLVKTKRRFSKNEKDFLQVLSRIIGNAIGKARLSYALKEREKKFTYLFENMAQGVVYQNAAGYIVDANPAAEKLLGLTLDQLQGKTSIDEDWMAMKSDGTPFPGEEHPAMVALATGKEVLNVEMGIYNPIKKRHTWILVSAEPEFGEDSNKPDSVYTTFTDITALKSIQRSQAYQAEIRNQLVDISKDFIRVGESDSDATINKALASLGRIVEADRFYVFDYHFDKMTCSNIYEWCAQGVAPMIDMLQEVPISEMTEWISRHRNGEMLAIPDVLALPEEDAVRQVLEPQGILSIITMPLMNGTECTGFIGLDFIQEKHAYSSSEQELLIIFANILSDFRKRLENDKALFESKALIAEIINNSPALVYRKNIKGQLVLVNKQWEVLLGILPTQAIGASDKELFGEDLGAIYKENDLKVLSSGKVLEIVEPVRVKEEIRYFNSIKFPLYDAKNKLVGIAGISTDMTEKRMLTEALKSSEANLRAILESSSDYIFTVDHELRLTYFNSSIAKVHKDVFKIDLQVGECVWDLIDKGEMTENWKQRWTRCFSGEVVEFSESQILPDGTENIVSGSVFPIYLEGQISGGAVFMKNITSERRMQIELEESEMRFRELFQKNTSLMLLVDFEQLTILDANPAAIAYYGLQECELGNVKYERLLKEPSNAKKLKQTIVENKFKYDCIHINGEDKPKNVEIHTTVFKQGKRSVIHLIIHDVSEKIDFYKKVMQQNERLKEIAWIQSHVVRAPVARILSLSYLLKEKEDEEFTHEKIIESIVSSVLELDEIIKEISDKTNLIYPM